MDRHRPKQCLLLEVKKLYLFMPERQGIIINYSAESFEGFEWILNWLKASDISRQLFSSPQASTSHLTFCLAWKTLKTLHNKNSLCLYLMGGTTLGDSGLYCHWKISYWDIHVTGSKMISRLNRLTMICKFQEMWRVIRL